MGLFGDDLTDFDYLDELGEITLRQSDRKPEIAKTETVMDHNQVLELEEALERVIVDVLRKHYPHEVLHRVRHLMAKAAVAVLEAVEEAKAEE